ncbi:MAG: hypothetical protein HQL32_10970, partial [Planctomycetes bacterium]|nr:hypothetical protein [Planctomycetota bacterium]
MNRFIKILFLFCLAPSFFSLSCSDNLPAPKVSVAGGERRIDLQWQESLGCLYEVQRSPINKDKFTTIHPALRMTPRYSDRVEKNNLDFDYRVRAILKEEVTEKVLRVSPWSQTLTGGSKSQPIREQIHDLQKASFEYFWSYAHPNSGLIREGTLHGTDTQHTNWLWRLCTVGATGMAFFNYAVGVEREWISREEASERVLSTLRFLKNKSTRYHGAWPHWIDGGTGETIPFSDLDDGADLVETAFMAKALIFAREYFSHANEKEKEIRKISHTLWREIEWSFFLTKDANDPYLLWH